MQTKTVYHNKNKNSKKLCLVLTFVRFETLTLKQEDI